MSGLMHCLAVGCNHARPGMSPRRRSVWVCVSILLLGHCRVHHALSRSVCQAACTVSRVQGNRSSLGTDALHHARPRDRVPGDRRPHTSSAILWRTALLLRRPLFHRPVLRSHLRSPYTMLRRLCVCVCVCVCVYCIICIYRIRC